MGWKTKPTLIRLTEKFAKDKWAIPFSYDFSTDPVSLINLNGYAFNGAQFTFNISSVQQVQNLPPIRSMQFSCDFRLDTPAYNPGALIVYIPATGSFTRIAYGGSLPGGATNATGIVSGVIPVVTNDPTTIIFAKEVDDGGPSIVAGEFWAQLLTFDIPPYIAQGRN